MFCRFPVWDRPKSQRTFSKHGYRRWIVFFFSSSFLEKHSSMNHYNRMRQSTFNGFELSTPCTSTLYNTHEKWLPFWCGFDKQSTRWLTMLVEWCHDEYANKWNKSKQIAKKKTVALLCKYDSMIGHCVAMVIEPFNACVNQIKSKHTASPIGAVTTQIANVYVRLFCNLYEIIFKSQYT